MREEHDAVLQHKRCSNAAQKKHEHGDGHTYPVGIIQCHHCARGKGQQQQTVGESGWQLSLSLLLREHKHNHLPEGDVSVTHPIEFSLAYRTVVLSVDCC